MRKEKLKIRGIPSREIKFWTNLVRIGTKTENWHKLNILSKWFVLVRGVSLTITLIAVIIGGMLSLLIHKFNTLLFLITALGLVIAHSTSNLINDWWDFKNKIDTPEYFRNKYNLHPLSVINEKKLLTLIFFSGLLALLTALYLTSVRGITVLVLSFVGFLIMFFYSGQPIKLKYLGLGEPLVLITWGPLMICGVFYVITGYFYPWVLLASIPYGLGAMLILLGKHTDKIEEDKLKGVSTLPVIIGERNSIRLAVITIILMHIFALALVITERFTVGPLFTLLALPRNLRAIRYVLSNKKPSTPENLPEEYPKDLWPIWYVGGAFLINRQFGTYYILGIIAEIAIASL